MQDRTTPSTDCSSSEPAPIFPYRSDPNDAEHPSSLQRNRQTHTLAGPIKRHRSRRSFAHLVAVTVPIMCHIVASTASETSVRAQAVTHSETIDRFAEFIRDASTRFAVPASWIRAVMRIESGGDQHATSPRGALGLMQLMPGTWVELSARNGLGLDPFDPQDNILAGTAYLKEMRERFGSAGFLAAYHAGPARYEQHLATGRPLPQETVSYVAAVTPLLTDDQNSHAASRIGRAVPWRHAPLFIQRGGVR